MFQAGVPGPKYKVLPFVHISKVNVIPPVVVTDKAKTDNPAREAARALDLEKLIGHTSKIIEESSTILPTESQDEEDIRRLESALETSPPIVYPEIPEDAMILPFDTEQMPDATQPQSQDPIVITIVAPPRQVTLPPRPVTPPPRQTTPEPRQATPPPDQNQVPVSEQSTPKLKIETPDEDLNSRPKRSHTSEVIYCLDSDEDDVPAPKKGPEKGTVIDLSDENDKDIPPSKTSETAENGALVTIRLPMAQLYKCYKCQKLWKSGHTLKRHYFDCYPNASDILRCAHCPFTSENKNGMLNHYGKQHGPVTTYMCGICNKFEADTKENVNQHVAATHGAIKVIYHAEKRGENKEHVNVALPVGDTGPKPRGRRKRSSGESAPTTPAKLKRYGLDTLPINQIFDEPVQCSLCDFSNKVRQNMIRHFQLHSQQLNVPQNAPVNPVPHLESNEMHFDKMLNLASSSITTRAGDASEPSSRYPGFIPERERYACGARDCSYISINEAMLKCHWETLHYDSNNYHCVHCPPIQQLDTSRPLTAGRIIAHLKMHDAKLFGCSACMFYHHQQHLVEKHVTEKHSGNARVKPIRGPAVAPTPPPQPTPGAPTMDLKPWQCGLCKFKSMLRPEVVEHCSKTHQSKFQFKCCFCPWRSSAIENVTKHLANSHAGQKGEVFYFYYREGSLPDVDGMPLWMKQRQKTNPQDSEVKAEKDPPPPSKDPPLPPPRPEVDLNLVKKETDEPETMEALRKKFGEFCEPNGLKYKCSLCKLATEDNKEAMQSHLYEELKYRK